MEIITNPRVGKGGPRPVTRSDDKRTLRRGYAQPGAGRRGWIVICTNSQQTFEFAETQRKAADIIAMAAQALGYEVEIMKASPAR